MLASFPSDFRGPLNIHRGRDRGALFRHTSQKSFVVEQQHVRIFVSSDEKIPRAPSRTEFLEVPFNHFSSKIILHTTLYTNIRIFSIEFDKVHKKSAAGIDPRCRRPASPYPDEAFPRLVDECPGSPEWAREDGRFISRADTFPEDTFKGRRRPPSLCRENARGHASAFDFDEFFKAALRRSYSGTELPPIP